MGGSGGLKDSLVQAGQHRDAAQLCLGGVDALAGQDAAQLLKGGEVELVLLQDNVAVRVEQKGAVIKPLPGAHNRGARQDIDRGLDGQQREEADIAFIERLGQILIVKLQGLLHRLLSGVD